MVRFPAKADRKVRKATTRLAKLQYLLPANADRSVLIVLQGSLAAHWFMPRGVPISEARKTIGKPRMANGWAPDGAVQDQIEDSIKDALSSARARMPSGEGLEECEDCGEDIPVARREALPGARTCVSCQSARDKRPSFTGINRRGSKDSQLR